MKIRILAFNVSFLGDWFCPPCQQDILIVSLEQRLIKFDECVAQKKEEELLQIEKEKEMEDLLRINMTKKKKKENTSHKKGVNTDSSDDSNDDEKLDKSSSEDSSINFRSTKKKAREVNSDIDSSSLDSYDEDDDEPIYKLRKRRQINVSYRYVSN